MYGLKAWWMAGFLMAILGMAHTGAMGYGYTTLSDVDINAIIEMRQEEKMAMDVYEYFYEKWGLDIFRRIANSEEQHTNAVKNLIDKYSLDDPLTTMERGVYPDEKYTQLYIELTSEGELNVVDALKVGALIEDLDIKDLQEWLVKVENPELKRVLCNLMQGSENHLRAFVRELEMYGETYTPQYLTEEEFNTILSGGTLSTEYGCTAKGRRGPPFLTI